MIDEIGKKIANAEPLTSEETTEFILFLLQTQDDSDQLAGLFGVGTSPRLQTRIYSGGIVAGTGTDPDAPQTTFTGAAFLNPGVTINGTTYNVVGMNNGTLEFGIASADGRAYFASGTITLDALGLTLNGIANPLNFSATYSGNTRNASIGMQLPAGSSIPAWQLTFYQPGASESLTNPGFETGSYAGGWTAAADLAVVTSGVGNYTAVAPYAGAYMTQFTYNGSTRTLVATRVAATAGQSWTTGLRLWLDYPNLTVLGQLLWYDDPAAGALLRTDTYLSQTGGQPGWTNPVGAFIAPAGAQSVAYILTFAGTGLTGVQCFVDDCTLKLTTVYSSLSFEPHATLRGTPLDFDSLAAHPASPNPDSGLSLYNISRKAWTQDQYLIRSAALGIARPDIRAPRYCIAGAGNAWVDMAGLATSGTITSVYGDFARATMQHTTGAVSGNACYTAWALHTRAALNPHMMVHFFTDASSISNMRFWVGFHSTAPNANPAPGTWATLKYDATISGTLTAQDNLDGSTHSVATVTIGLSSIYDIEIWIDSANHLVHYFVNGVHYQTNPSGTISAANLFPYFYVETRTSAAKNLFARYIYQDED